MKKIDINLLSRLSNIGLDAINKVKLKEDLAKIIKHIEKIHEVDVEGITPTTHPYLSNLPLREDREEPPLLRDNVLSNTLFSIKGYFFVERLMDEENS